MNQNSNRKRMLPQRAAVGHLRLLFGALLGLVLALPAMPLQALAAMNHQSDAILNSADDSASWIVQASGTTKILQGVVAVDAQTAWAVGDGGTILKTINGGDTWSLQTSGTAALLSRVAAVDAQTAWAVGVGGTILKTTNGGVTWTAQASGTTQQLLGVTAVDAQNAWIVGLFGIIRKTSDGGATWTAQTSGTTAFLTSVAAVDAQTAWAVGFSGTVLKTTNGGTTWTAQTSGTTTAQLYSITVVDGQTAWAVGYEGGIIRKTTNGGATWIAQSSGTTQQLLGVTAVDRLTAFAVGGGGTVVRTSDGGVTWSGQTSGATSYLADVAAFDSWNAWAVGGNGTIVHMGPPLSPSLLNPASGMQLNNLGPQLAWTTPAGTTQVQLQVVPSNNDGPGLSLILGPVTSFAIPPPPTWYGMLPGMSYSWRVRASARPSFAAEDDPSWGPWSTSSTFRMPVRDSSRITPVSPANGVTVGSGSQVLQWDNGDKDVFYYEIQVSPDSRVGEGGPIASVWTNLVHGGVTTPPNSWKTPEMQSGSAYFWRVRPRVQGDGTPVAWTTTWSFRAQ